jgi:nucleoside-diphosphate-sugar epimerase
MKIFVTGAFGNIGMHVIQQLVSAGHHIRCFDMKTSRNLKKAQRLDGQVEIIWGDLTQPDTYQHSLDDIQAVIHLAAIIPPVSEKHTELAQKVNVSGTRTLIEAMQLIHPSPKLIFTSSISVHGYTQDRLPPRRVHDPLNPTDYYSTTKVECEKIIQASSLQWVILRLSAVAPVELTNFDPIMFDIPYSTRIEFVHPSDVALALVNAAFNQNALGKIFLIGGGTQCQMRFEEYLTRLLQAHGVGALPVRAFSVDAPFYLDWLDTTEGQEMLHYQNHSFDSFVTEMRERFGAKRYLVSIFRKVAQFYLLSKSPYWKTHKEQ